LIATQYRATCFTGIRRHKNPVQIFRLSLPFDVGGNLVPTMAVIPAATTYLRPPQLQRANPRSAIGTRSDECDVMAISSNAFGPGLDVPYTAADGKQRLTLSAASSTWEPTHTARFDGSSPHEI
jgi:hypothetical protein